MDIVGKRAEVNRTICVKRQIGVKISGAPTNFDTENQGKDEHLPEVCPEGDEEEVSGSSKKRLMFC
jgi:hypothetical protein